MMRIAVIGSGWAGTRQTEAAAELNRKVLIEALVDSDADFLCDRATQLGVDKTFINIADALADPAIDAVIISHFHLDHCGALPYMTEMVGYSGPIYMTHPTKAIAPILLEDMRRVAVERKGETNFFTSQMIKDCMKKVVTVGLHEVVKVDDELVEPT